MSKFDMAVYAVETRNDPERRRVDRVRRELWLAAFPSVLRHRIDLHAWQVLVRFEDWAKAQAVVDRFFQAHPQEAL